MRKEEKGKSWNGGANTYHLDSPSPYVEKEGIQFLRSYHQGGLPIADIGVYEGSNLPTLLTVGVPVIATDIPEAREVVLKTQKQYPTVSFIMALLTSLPFSDCELAKILSWRVLHNCTGRDFRFRYELLLAFAELNRVMMFQAPLLIAVRYESQSGLLNSQCIFIRNRTNGNGGVRKDVYFTRRGLKSIAELMGFRVMYVTDVKEDEQVNGITVKNHYLVAHLVKNTVPRSCHLDMAEHHIVRIL